MAKLTTPKDILSYKTNNGRLYRRSDNMPINFGRNAAKRERRKLRGVRK